MASSGLLHLVALVRTDVSEELSPSIIRVTRFGELGTTLAVTSNRRTLRKNNILVTAMKETLSSFETPVLKRATRRNILEDAILQVYVRSFTEWSMSHIERGATTQTIATPLPLILLMLAE
jgi:hypothetical protein